MAVRICRVIYFCGPYLDRLRIPGGGKGRARSPICSGSPGTKTCTITSVQVLFSKLLNFNFETRFRFLYGAIHALAANAIQVESLCFRSSALKLQYPQRFKMGVDLSVAKIFSSFALPRSNFNIQANCFLISRPSESLYPELKTLHSGL